MKRSLIRERLESFLGQNREMDEETKKRIVYDLIDNSQDIIPLLQEIIEQNRQKSIWQHISARQHEYNLKGENMPEDEKKEYQRMRQIMDRIFSY